MLLDAGAAGRWCCWPLVLLAVGAAGRWFFLAAGAAGSWQTSAGASGC